MRPNVRMGGSMAGGGEESSAVQAFSRMRTAGTRAAGQMIGQGVSDIARAATQRDLSFRRTLVDSSIQMFRPRGYSPGAAPSTPVRDNRSSFDAIGRALGEIVGFNRGGQASQSSSSSPGPRTFWQPRGDDGWGNTQLGARGSNQSMVSKAIAGFSFL